MKIKCIICRNNLKELGALIFSPPDKEGMVKKHHVCKSCFKDEYLFLNMLSDPIGLRNDGDKRKR